MLGTVPISDAIRMCSDASPKLKLKWLAEFPSATLIPPKSDSRQLGFRDGAAGSSFHKAEVAVGLVALNGALECSSRFRSWLDSTPSPPKPMLQLPPEQD